MENNLEFIDIKIDSGVCTITMNRVEKRNAINSQFVVELCSAWDIVDNDDEIRVAVLKSADTSVFSAGADLKELIPLFRNEIDPQNKFDELIQDINYSRKFVRKDKVRTKPLIGVASGYCLAGGFELLLCCDFRLIEENTIVGYPESTIGLLPVWGGISRIGQVVSRAKALEILLDSKNISVHELKNLGVVNDVFQLKNIDNIQQEYIDKILNSTPKAVELLMKNIDKVQTVDINESFLLEEEMFRDLI
jgi:enoyl-CoA hydratase/carnithine racemase